MSAAGRAGTRSRRTGGAPTSSRSTRTRPNSTTSTRSCTRWRTGRGARVGQGRGGQGRRAGLALCRRHIRLRHRIGDPGARPRRRPGDRRTRPRPQTRRARWPSRFRAGCPSGCAGLLSDEYHANEGGHIRIYRADALRDKVSARGLRLTHRHHAHALHSPFWWLKCLVGTSNSEHPAVVAYHKLLVWDMMQPAVAHPDRRVGAEPVDRQERCAVLPEAGGAGCSVCRDVPARARGADPVRSAGRPRSR